jgi:hypothetical protein
MFVPRSISPQTDRPVEFYRLGLEALVDVATSRESKGGWFDDVKPLPYLRMVRLGRTTFTRLKIACECYLINH